MAQNAQNKTCQKITKQTIYIIVYISTINVKPFLQYSISQEVRKIQHILYSFHVRFINFQLSFVSGRTVSSARARIFHTRGTLPLRQATQRHIKSEKTRFKCRRAWSTPFMEYCWHLARKTCHRKLTAKRKTIRYNIFSSE